MVSETDTLYTFPGSPVDSKIESITVNSTMDRDDQAQSWAWLMLGY